MVRDLSADRPAPELPSELRPWLRKTQRNIVLFTLRYEPFLIWKMGRPRWRRLLSLWGIYPRGTPKSIWIHAFGIGEMRVAIALIQALPQDLSFVVTSSDESRELVRKTLGDRVELTFIPFPFRFVVRRFLRRYSPRQLIMVEMNDLRPLLCLHLMPQELPAAVVNGRVDLEMIEPHPCSPYLDRIQLFGVRGEKDRELLAGRGIPHDRIVQTGEMKIDAMAFPNPELEAQMQELAGGRPILIAGSIDPDEGPQILDAFLGVGGGDRAMLILAPKIAFHLAEELLRNRGLGFVRRSRFPVSLRPAVVLLDSIGELASLYRIAAAAFIGNSLTPEGSGHNPIEPACFAVPVAVGPHMSNFQSYADLFDRAGAWQRVADAEELARAWTTWLDNPELARQTGRRAAKLVESQRGLAMARTLELLRPFLGRDGWAAIPSPHDVTEQPQLAAIRGGSA